MHYREYQISKTVNHTNILIKDSRVSNIEEGILEAKTECYAKDKVKSPRFF